MRLGYFAMPMHPQGRTWADTLREDREAVILADRLGFHDAFIGEHLTDRHETITNSLVFLATLINDTTQIRLGTGTTNLSHMHPALVAVNSAMFDHLSGGRFILGVSPGALPSDAELLGILDEDRNQMFAEAIDVITRLWELDPPYDIDLPGTRFRVTTATTFDDEVGVGIVGKPLQTPRPEIELSAIENTVLEALSDQREVQEPEIGKLLEERGLAGVLIKAVIGGIIRKTGMAELPWVEVRYAQGRYSYRLRPEAVPKPSEPPLESR